jgi:hypothetical protein
VFYFDEINKFIEALRRSPASTCGARRLAVRTLVAQVGVVGRIRAGARCQKGLVACGKLARFPLLM